MNAFLTHGLGELSMNRRAVFRVEGFDVECMCLEAPSWGDDDDGVHGLLEDGSNGTGSTGTTQIAST